MLILTIATILQAFAISLGVGSSTIAIINFFVAISDGTIDASERKLMGGTYVLLRVAMVAILLTYLYLVGGQVLAGGMETVSANQLVQGIVIAVLFVNAFLMTKRIMPSTFGPGIQAGSWYTLGTLAALQLAQVYGDLWQLLLVYIGLVVTAVVVVRIVMSRLKKQSKPK